MNAGKCIKDIIKEVDQKMANISEISLENDDYNELFLELRSLRTTLVKVAKHQHKINSIKGKIALDKEMTHVYTE